MTDIKSMIIKKVSKDKNSDSYDYVMDPNFRSALKQRIINAKNSKEDLLLLDNGCMYSVQTVTVVKKLNWNCKNGTFEIARTSRRKPRQPTQDVLDNNQDISENSTQLVKKQAEIKGKKERLTVDANS